MTDRRKQTNPDCLLSHQKKKITILNTFFLKKSPSYYVHRDWSWVQSARQMTQGTSPEDKTGVLPPPLEERH